MLQVWADKRLRAAVATPHACVWMHINMAIYEFIYIYVYVECCHGATSLCYYMTFYDIIQLKLFMCSVYIGCNI